MTTRNQQFKAVQEEGLELFTRKNKDYGDAFADYGVVGVLVRMGDKIRRLQNISNTGVTLVHDESFRDTLIDLHNYAAMAVLLMDSNSNMVSTSSEEVESDDDDEIVNEEGSKARHVWWVPSSTTSNTNYEVVKYEDGSMSCTCKGFEHHGWCKHCSDKHAVEEVNVVVDKIVEPEPEPQPKRAKTNESGIHKWFVQSDSNPEEQYEVTKHSDGTMKCTCKGFEHRGWCKHCERYKN